MKRYLGWICLIIALLGAIMVGWIDFNNDETQAAVLVILILTALLGGLYPQKSWLWAIIVALGLPAVYLTLHAIGYEPASPPSPGWYASLLALIPAFIGAYAGAIARLMMNKAGVES